MPPKKKDKKKDKKASAKNKPITITPVAEPLSELSRENYLNQIRDLEGQLARYQRRWDELQVREANFQAELEQVTQDKKEIVAFLKRTLDERTDEIAELKEKTENLQESKDVEKEAFEAQLSQVRNEFQETKDQLTSENKVLAGKLAALEEFRVEKEDLAEKFAALEELMKQQELEHKEVIYNLERKAVVDKERLKKEMVQRVNLVAGEFRKVSNNQIAETTKRTIRENVSICAQLAKMSDKSMELILEIDRLKKTQIEQRRQVELLEHNEKVLVKNNLSNQKVIRMLTEKCQEQQMLLDDAMEKGEEWRTLQISNTSLKEENQSLRERVARLERDVKRHESEAARVKVDLQLERKSKKMVESILSKAAKALKDVLLEKPGEEEEFEGMHEEHRHQMLQKLLALLNTAATLGLGPKLEEFLSQETEPMEQITMPKGDSSLLILVWSNTPAEAQCPITVSGCARAFALSPGLKDTGGISHYQIGDLGLVPRPYQTASVLSKMGMLSKTTRLGPLRASKSAPKYLFPVSNEEKQIKQPPLLPDIGSASETASGRSLDIPSEIINDVAPQVIAEVAPEVVAEVAPEVVAEVAPEVVAEIASEVIAEVATKVVPEVITEVVTEVSPELVTVVAPEHVTKVTPEDAPKVASEVIRVVASKVASEIAPEVASKVASVVVPKTSLKVASAVVSKTPSKVASAVVPKTPSKVASAVVPKTPSKVASAVVPKTPSKVASAVVPKTPSKVASEVVAEVHSRVASDVTKEDVPETTSKMTSEVVPEVPTKVASVPEVTSAVSPKDSTV